jgi:antitoxin MazE
MHRQGVLAMRAKIVRIGNSRGIRIPKLLLEEGGFEDEVEIELEGECLLIRPTRTIREGWAAAFMSMAEAGDDQLLDDDVVISAKWDNEEWEWE